MTTDNGYDLLGVNCGRCGKPLIRSVEHLRDRRTIDCDDCEKTLPARERTSRIHVEVRQGDARNVRPERRGR